MEAEAQPQAEAGGGQARGHSVGTRLRTGGRGGRGGRARLLAAQWLRLWYRAVAAAAVDGRAQRQRVAAVRAIGAGGRGGAERRGNREQAPARGGARGRRGGHGRRGGRQSQRDMRRQRPRRLSGGPLRRGLLLHVDDERDEVAQVKQAGAAARGVVDNWRRLHAVLDQLAERLHRSLRRGDQQNRPWRRTGGGGGRSAALLGASLGRRVSARALLLLERLVFRGGGGGGLGGRERGGDVRRRGRARAAARGAGGAIPG